MRKLTRKQILARLFVGFFTLGSLFFTVNSAVANTVKIENENNYSEGIIAGGNYNAGDVESNSVEIINSNINSGQIFGGRRSGGGGLVSSNTVTISDNSTVSDLVYGGNAFGEGADGRVEYNKVVITESYLGKSAYGGKVNVKGSATGNSVDVSENSVITENVYGAEVWSSGDAVSNKADIASSTVKNSVYGGWVGSGSATLNEVYIASSTVNGSVYGGYVKGSGSATQNKVTIASSTVKDAVNGGYVGSGSATQNIVDISSSTIEQTVYGGNAGTTGSATQNIVNITSGSTVNNTVFGGRSGDSGNADSNEVKIASSTVNNTVYGGRVYSGNANQNKVTIASSTVGGEIRGGCVSSIGSATKNIVDIASSTVTGSVYGGYVAEGSAAENRVDISNSTINGTYVSGGYVGNTGSATLNIVNIASSTVKTVYGGYVATGTGNVALNEVAISSSKVTAVYGGNAGTGNATENKVAIASSTTTTVYGGYTKEGNATDNSVVIRDGSKVTAVSGGNVVGTGSATLNEVDIASSTTNAVYGGKSSNGNADSNKVKIASSTVNGAVYGGRSSNGNADSNEVKITNSSVVGTVNVTYVYGGYVGNTGSATRNIVDIASSTIKNGSVYGGYVGGNGNATDNTVEISGGSTVTGFVYGGNVGGNGNATGNTVKIIDGSANEVYGGYVGGNGNATNNTVEISGGSTVDKDVYGGRVGGTGDTNDAVTDNKLIIAGAGNTIGGKIVNFETMTFDAADVKKDETMLSLTTESSFTFGVESIENNNANLAVGEKITLISSEVDNIYDGITFKIDGKQAIRDGNNFIANVAKEDSDKVVHVNEYAYEYNTSDYKLNLCNNSGFITGLYNGFDAEGAKQTLGQAEMTVSSVPENVTEIYGAYSEDADVVAGGATINLETTELSDVDLIGSYNLKDETKVDTSNNTLNVNVSGVKVKSVKGFDTMNFKLASDEKPMLESAGGFVLNGVSINSLLPEDGFDGSATILTATGAINSDGVKLKINNTDVDNSKPFATTIVNVDSVVYGTYEYGLEKNSIILNGKSYVCAVNTADKEIRKTDDSSLKVTSKMAEKYTELYGAFNADGGVAIDATVNLSEVIDNENLTIYGGYSTGSGADVTTGNTLKVLKNGNKIKNILNFSKLDFSLDSDNSNNPIMLALAADTVDLSKASINVNLTNALAEGQTVTLLGAAQQLNLSDDKLTIDGKVLGSDLSLNIAKKVEEKYVNVGGYSLEKDTSKLSIKANDAVLTSRYRNGAEELSVEKFELTNDLSKFRNIYGSYSADNSAAEGGRLFISEKVDLSDTTLIGGYSVGNGEVKNNSLEISSAAAGSKVNGVSKFSDVNVKLDNAIAEGQTVTLLEANKLELTDSVFTINNKALDSNLSLKFADDSTKKYVSIGEYNLKNSDNKLSISAKESLLTSRYRNGAEDLSVEKFELTKDLNKFKNIYGSYSADNSAAEGGKLSINEKADLSQTALIGGYSASNGEVKNNTLEISSAAVGSKVKGVEKFDNIKFVLASDASGNTPVLSTTDRVVLEGTTIDTDMSGFNASGNTSLVLLDNTEGKAAKRLINGTEGEVFNANDTGSFVAINSIGYSDDEDKVAIDVKNVGAAGAFIDKDGNLTGRMELTLGDSTASNVRANVRAGFSRASEGSDLSDYEDIYGFYSAGEKDPTGPITVNIVSAIDYRNTVLHGGYRNGNRYAKNTKLVIDSLNVKLKGVTDFETMTFNLPAETKNGDTMLKVADAVDMAQTKTVVEAKKATGLKAGDSVNLIDSEVGIQNFDSQKYTISDLTDKTGEVKVEGKALVLALDENGEKPNKNTKAPVEAVSATMALVNQASALASDKLNKSMTAAVASANGGSATFASMNGGHSKYETGSYVEADSWNIGFGIAKKGMSSKNPDSTYGLFFQYGKSNFDTHNDGGFRGDGDSKMFGAGLTFHQEARSKFYYHGNIYAGKVDAKWNCSEGGYDDDAAYWGMTFGMGRKHNAGGNKTMDVYGRYSFNHVGSMDGKIGGNEYRFDSTCSHNLRLGLRMEYAQKNAATAYWGLAWEHEFAGDSKATVVKLGRTDSPTLNGNTGIAEVGYEWKRGNWEYNINAEGSFGKRKGVTGSFNINYNF